MLSRGVVLAALLALAPACSEPPRPNLILVSVDTLRADRLSALGESARPTTPVLDGVAAESALFADCRAASTVTGPSHLSLFTGQLPTRHGLRENGGRVAPRATLASLLRDAGYATAGFTGGGYLRESYGLAHGFDTYRARGGPLARFKRTVATSLPFALEWLDGAPREPFFLFVHGYDPHCPYEAPAEHLRRLARLDGSPGEPAAFDPTGRCGEKDYVPLLEQGRLGERELAYLALLYDALVRSADEALAPLVARLRRDGLLDRSLFVFVSDHGESLGEHGWIGHGRLWAEQARVPLFVRFPEGRHAGRVDAPVSLVDVLPTLLDALGLPHGAGAAGLQGASLMPLLRGEPFEPARPRVVVFGDGEAVDFGGRWRAHLSPEGTSRLFDLAADPREERDLAATPEGAARLAELLGRYRAWRAAEAPADERFRIVAGAAEATEEERLELNALGYVEGD